ncbi:PIR protein [Plasmodium yoelii yoelii]|uniref:PIR protein n=1 Tax=Plasmodium yoelii yoelii TaxID=73239 RepID=A0AAE9WLY0_PLAYO|nr:PIR protein [Plasmodium yoelii yoelii]
MVSKVCDAINLIDKYFDGDPNNSRKDISGGLLNLLISENNCSNDDPKLISDFIALLTLFNDIGSDENLDRNNCYNNHIAAGSGSGKKIYMEVINEKIESMNIDIKDISNFYDAFKSLCNMYSEIDVENYQCNKCLENAGEFFEKCEKVKNAFDIDKGSSYLQLWSSLSNDYNIFKQEYFGKCNSISQLVACPRSSVTQNTLITIAIIFVAASILLGVSYKYSLFGFRKRSQKQHLREMLKK